jgi:hypothetical protein
VITCDVVLPDSRTVVIGFARVPVAGEQINLDAASAPEEGEQWPEAIAGLIYDVAAVIWAAPAPAMKARPIVLTKGGAP